MYVAERQLEKHIRLHEKMNKNMCHVCMCVCKYVSMYVWLTGPAHTMDLIPFSRMSGGTLSFTCDTRVTFPSSATWYWLSRKDLKRETVRVRVRVRGQQR